MVPLVTALIPVVGKVIDNIFPDPEQANQAKLKMLELQQSGQLSELTAAARIVEVEANSDHWLTSAWRPIVMLFLTGCVGAYWFGFTAPNLPEPAVIELLAIVKFGLGGYVLGRSAEKTAKAWREKARGS